MSEIALDNEHRFPAVRYSSLCDSLCGYGSTLIFEKMSGEWQDSELRGNGPLDLAKYPSYTDRPNVLM